MREMLAAATTQSIIAMLLGVGERHVRHVQTPRRLGSLSSALYEPLSADAPAAERSRGGAGGTGEEQPLLGPQGLAGAAGAARPDACQALWLSRAAGWGRAPLSAERHVACRALRARHLGLSLLRSARRAGADRRAHPGAAAKSLLLRTQGTGAVGSRPGGGGDR